MRIPGTAITINVGALIGIILGPLLIVGLIYYYIYRTSPVVTFQDVEPDGHVVAGTPPAEPGKRLEELLLLGNSAQYAVLFEKDTYSGAKDQFVLRIQDGERWSEDSTTRWDELLGDRTLSNGDHCFWIVKREGMADVSCSKIAFSTVANLLPDIATNASLFDFETFNALAGHNVECYRRAPYPFEDTRICLDSEGVPLLIEHHSSSTDVYVRAIEVREVPTGDWYQPTIDHPVVIDEALDLGEIPLEDLRLPDIDVINERLAH